MCFFFKQKTAYEMRISDWSSDVCSSDLQGQCPVAHRCALAHRRDPHWPGGSSVSRQRPHGFTLIEVLVAFAVLAIGITVVAAMLNGGRRQVRYAAEASYAAQLAQSVLDAQGINGRLREGVDDGESDDGRVRWRLETREIADPLADPDTLDALQADAAQPAEGNGDRKSTRLNSSH